MLFDHVPAATRGDPTGQRRPMPLRNDDVADLHKPLGALLEDIAESGERAREFGDDLLAVDVPLPKLAFFSHLLPGLLRGEDEYVVVGGLYRLRLARLQTSSSPSTQACTGKRLRSNHIPGATIWGRKESPSQQSRWSDQCWKVRPRLGVFTAMLLPRLLRLLLGWLLPFRRRIHLRSHRAPVTKTRIRMNSMTAFSTCHTK